jgi:hypothetical protein
MKNVGTLCGRWEYIKALWYILRPLCNLVVMWYKFSILYHEKSGNAGSQCGQVGGQRKIKNWQHRGTFQFVDIHRLTDASFVFTFLFCWSSCVAKLAFRFVC